MSLESLNNTNEDFMLERGKQKTALIAMVELARQYSNGPTNVVDLSLRTDISVSYLEQIFAYLRGADLVVGVRGPGGGFMLNRAPALISIDEILEHCR
jgi:Rrf2 family iron-sulfur cluster assembly transcriptional regulator